MPRKDKKQKSLSLVVSRPFIPVGSVQPKPPTQSGVVYLVGAHVCLLRCPLRLDCFRRLLEKIFFNQHQSPFLWQLGEADVWKTLPVMPRLGDIG